MTTVKARIGGIALATPAGVVIGVLEDLFVYQKALAAATAVSFILKRLPFARDGELRSHIAASSSRVTALIAAGYDEKTDRDFARYLSLARESAAHTRAHLLVAAGRGYISAAEATDFCERYDDVARMLAGLVGHLEREAGPHRGPRLTD